MQPNSDFVKLSKEFWANIRTISQELGYTVQVKRQAGIKSQPGPIKVPTLAEIHFALESLRLSSDHLIAQGRATEFGRKVLDYFDYRADALNRLVEPLLMNGDQARALYQRLQRKLRAQTAAPMNKQSGRKKKPAYFTGIINMLIHSSLPEVPCNFNPQELTTITVNKQPFRTLARRIDGAFPGPVDPIAVWEIKEYYYTTTFGSRVADGVYETLLDGMELEELNAGLKQMPVELRPRPPIEHLLMIDAHYTWWVKGRSYLCRIIDMLHMGYVDEVLFGKEVETRIPEIVRNWVAKYRLADC